MMFNRREGHAVLLREHTARRGGPVEVDPIALTHGHVLAPFCPPCAVGHVPGIECSGIHFERAGQDAAN